LTINLTNFSNSASRYIKIIKSDKSIDITQSIMPTVKQAYNRDDEIMQIALLLFGATMRIQCYVVQINATA